MSDEIFLNHPVNHKRLLPDSHATPIEQLFLIHDIPKWPTIEPEYTSVSQFDLDIQSKTFLERGIHKNPLARIPIK